MAESKIKADRPWVNDYHTLSNDVLTYVRNLPLGFSYFPVSNKPTNRPSNNEWDSYLIYKWDDNKCTIISVSGFGLAIAVIRNLSTATDISWKVLS